MRRAKKEFYYSAKPVYYPRIPLRSIYCASLVRVICCISFHIVSQVSYYSLGLRALVRLLLLLRRGEHDQGEAVREEERRGDPGPGRMRGRDNHHRYGVQHTRVPWYFPHSSTVHQIITNQFTVRDRMGRVGAWTLLHQLRSRHHNRYQAVHQFPGAEVFVVSNKNRKKTNIVELLLSFSLLSCIGRGHP